MKKLIKFFATGFFVGYSPVAPGTAGTLVAVLLYIILPTGPIFYWVLLLCLVMGGTIVSQQAEKIFGEIDSSNLSLERTKVISFLSLRPNLVMISLSGAYPS